MSLPSVSLSSLLPSTPPPDVPLPSVPSPSPSQLERERLPPLQTHQAPLFTRATAHPPLNHLRRVKSKSSKASSAHSPNTGADSPPSPTPTYTSALQPAPTYRRPLPVPRQPISTSPSAPPLQDDPYLDSPSPSRERQAATTDLRAAAEVTEPTESDRDADLKREKLDAAAQLQERWANTEENVPGYEPAEVLAFDGVATARLQGPSPMPSHGSASTGPDSEKWMQDKASIDKWRKDQIKIANDQASSPPGRPRANSERSSDTPKGRGRSRMTDAEIAQHHFREAQKHLEMAQKLAAQAAATRQSTASVDTSSVYDEKPETPRSHAESSDDDVYSNFDDLRSAYRSTTYDEPFALESALRPDSRPLPAGYHTLGHSVSNSHIVHPPASAQPLALPRPERVECFES